MSEQLRFSKTVAEKLGFYVYRLIDPRSGDTFYVGKGTGDRVFDHAKGELGTAADELTDKLQRIRDIRRSGLEVLPIIHRHGMSEETAFDVEAALIDAYPSVANIVGGHDSSAVGIMHVRQIIERYKAPEIQFRHFVLLINVNRTVAEKSVYEAVRYAWKLDPQKAAKAEVILAMERGLVIGVFIADEWKRATVANFPALSADEPERWGFVGDEAPERIANLYLRHRLPDRMRKRGAANPIRYAERDAGLSNSITSPGAKIS